jgi:hypothetical protein
MANRPRVALKFGLFRGTCFSLSGERSSPKPGWGGSSTDAITVTVAGTPHTASGGNCFPDLGNTWQEMEFNIFGDGNGGQAVFNSGSPMNVRTGVSTGTTSGPGCADTSFTGESNNLTLVNTPPAPVIGPMPALLFSESFPAAAACQTPPPPPSNGRSSLLTCC